MRLLFKEVRVFEVFAFQIFRAGDDIFLIARPVDANLVVVSAYAVFVGRSVDVVNFISKDGLLAQH